MPTAAIRYGYAADLCEPLAAVADLAGGDLPERAREAITVILGGRTDSGAPQTPGQAALDALRTVWTGEAMTLADITRRMMALPGTPWASLWTPGSAPRELAALLEDAADRGVVAGPVGVPARRLDLGQGRAEPFALGPAPAGAARNGTEAAGALAANLSASGSRTDGVGMARQMAGLLRFRAPPGGVPGECTDRGQSSPAGPARLADR